jgi:tRNA threonylcarbamoyladenosine biosynthesis protein TsaE
MTVEITTYNADETLSLGKRLGQWATCGDVFALYGDLGSGKTQLTRGICSGLNSIEEVTSPTFTLINEYQGRCPIYHFDFYRIGSDEEVYSLGYEEYLNDDSICIIEWAERIEKLLPKSRIDVFLDHLFESGQESSRRIHIVGRGDQLRTRDWHALQQVKLI